MTLLIMGKGAENLAGRTALLFVVPGSPQCSGLRENQQAKSSLGY